MTRMFAEILLVAPMILNTGFLIFIAGVIQGIMNEIGEGEFKRFLARLHKHATRSPYTVIVSSVTFVGVIPYFIFYRFHNGWFTAGIVLWFIASIVSKSTNLPLYDRIFAIEDDDVTQLRDARKKLQGANIVRATLSLASVILVLIGFA